jgi:hypothetical protein
MSTKEVVPLNRPAGLALTSALMALCIVTMFFTINPKNPDSQSMWVCYIADSFFACVGFLFVWFYWKGRNWARVSVMVVSGLSIWNLRMWDVPVNLALHYPALLVTPFRVWLVYKALLGAVLLYYLNTPELRQFFTGKRTGHEQVSMAAK